jgi:hypothetical protein
MLTEGKIRNGTKIIPHAGGGLLISRFLAKVQYFPAMLSIGSIVYLPYLIVLVQSSFESPRGMQEFCVMIVLVHVVIVVR